LNFFLGTQSKMPIQETEPNNEEEIILRADPASLESETQPITYLKGSQKILLLSGAYALSRFIGIAGRFAEVKMFAEYGGADTLPALSLIGSTKMLLLGPGIGGLTATGILIRGAIAEGNNSDVGIIYQISILFGLGMTIAIIPIGCLSRSILENIFKQDADISLLTQDYFRVFSPAVFMVFVIISIQKFGMGKSGEKKLVIASSISYILSSLGFSYAFIFGKGAFPSLGAVKGLGGGASIGFSVTAILFNLYLYSRKKYDGYQLFSIRSLREYKEKRYASQLFSLGKYLALQDGIELVVYEGLTLMVGALGKEFLTIQLMAQMLLLAVEFSAVAVAEAVAILVKEAHSLQGFVSLRRYAKIALAVGTTVSVLGFIGATTFSKKCIALFIDVNDSENKEIAALATNVLIIRFLGQIADTSTRVNAGILSGLLDTRTPMFIRSFSLGFFSLPLAWLFAFPARLGLLGLSVGMSLGSLVGAIMMMVRVLQQFCRLEQVIEEPEQQSMFCNRDCFFQPVFSVFRNGRRAGDVPTTEDSSSIELEDMSGISLIQASSTAQGPDGP
jgi:MATE family multidrug resistance protein